MPVNVPRYEIELEQLNVPLVTGTCCGIDAVQWRLSNAEEPGKRGDVEWNLRKKLSLTLLPQQLHASELSDFQFAKYLGQVAY